jgi:hypothetical protein
MTIIDHANLYFRAYALKDYSHLRDLLHSEVLLCDWSVQISGRDNVLLEMSKVFCTFVKIEITLINIYSDKNTVIAELIVTLDNELIKVVDILEFSRDRKIISIRAFKG